MSQGRIHISYMDVDDLALDKLTSMVNKQKKNH